MSHDLISSSVSFDYSPSSVLHVRDVAGDYRQVDADEVLQAAQQVLLGRVRGSDILGSPQAVRDYLGHEYEEMTRQYVDYMPKKLEKASEAYFQEETHSFAAELMKGEFHG